MRRVIFERAMGCCGYCLSQERFATQAFSKEYIVPRSKGGPEDTDNLALACQGCNNHKYTRTEAMDPLTGQMAPLYHPRRQNWVDHFVWREDGSLILGLKPTGRATVEAIRPNRSGVIAMRQILFLVGLHPPDLG